MNRPGWIAVALAIGTGAVLALLGTLQAQQIHRNSLEAREPAWMRGPTDANFRELLHQMTDATAHTGQRSEHLQLATDQGSYIYYHYPTGRAPVAEDLSLSVWLKANRPGVQVLARIVLPRERNPANLDEPLTTLVRGDVYQLTSRWQRLEVRRVVKLAKEQQTLMRAQVQRDVDFTDAYIDRLVLNVYSGPGQTEVWIDDLEVGPVLDPNVFQSTSRTREKGREESPESPPRTPNRAALVELNQDQLLINGRRFFFRGIRRTDTPLKVLRDAGFNAVWFESSTPANVLEEAVNQGFWIVPSLQATTDVNRLANGLSQDIARFLERDAVLFWDLGGGLEEEQAVNAAKVAEVVRAADPQRPRGADVWDGFRTYSRHLDLMGVHRWPLMTGMELTQYRDWLNQRRLLAYRSPFLWTWVQTHLPDWYTALVYDRPATASFSEPIGPQPEQIRLLTYVALSAGCRGIAFWSDRFLADSHQGRDRLLCLALLNQELRMLEPLLLAAESPVWIDTSLPEVKAAVLRTDKGVLVLPMWLGRGAQFVPGQQAARSMTMVVPQVPVGTQAWEVSPGDVKCLQTKRVVGGTQVTIPEFSLTAAVVFTADNNPNGLVVRLQDQARQSRQSAAQWSYNLAEVQLEKVSRVQTELERSGHTLPDAASLLADARRRLQTTAQFYNGGDYRQAYLEAQRVQRPLRILMRAQWDAAVKELDAPMASPYAVSFYTLPRHWEFLGRVRQARASATVLPYGGFEPVTGQTSDSWVLHEITLDGVDMTARRVPDNPREGRQCMMLQIQPKNAQSPIAALERTFLAVTSPMVRLEPGRLVQVSGWIRIPAALGATADGALFYDSAGGEPLGIRLTQATDWKRFTLYRQVPASGTLNVTLALTGLGTVYFDDIRIEPLDGGGETQPGRQTPGIPVSRSQP